MKYFSANTIQDSLSNSGIEDSFLALLCVCKVLNASQQPNLNNWMSFEKSDLVRELVYYFDFETGKIKESDGNGSLSIIFAKNYAMSFGKVNPVHLGAICFRKHGIPETINSVNELINYLKSEFYLTEDFCNEVFLRNEAALPEFDDNFSNIEFEQLLKEQNHIDNEDGFFAISCGPKKVIKNSAGALGAAYFQTLYSKMPSKVCLITEYPDEYSSFKLDDEENTRNNAVLENFSPAQIIYYGVPGCGKSNTIKEKLKSVPDFNKVCVVFHPDYTNSEFIGQIRPKVRNHSVTYEFVAGPFAKILRRAYLNPNQEFYLVIDEINRGKASAILGEVFQLCDRIKPNDGKDEFSYGPGWSVYGVDHEDLNDYIRDIKSFANESHEGCDIPVEFAAEDGRGEVFAYKAIDINWPGFGEDGKLHFTENTAIRLPPNLSIFATMNTSDQNVFTLDNAFQRRFDMELVCNEFAKGSVDSFKTEAIRNQHNAKIAGTETTWGEFWEWANNKITQVLKGLSSTEDKRLGVWFVCNVNGEIPEKVFAEKVLKYLWDDAFKFKRTQIFAEGCDTLETLISKFHEVKFEVFRSFGRDSYKN